MTSLLPVKDLGLTLDGGEMLPLIFAAVSAVAGFTAAWQIQGMRHDSIISEQRAAQSALLVEAHVAAKRETERLQAAVDEAQRLAEKRKSDMARAAAAARIERDGLRDELAAARAALPNASCSSVREHAATLNTVFGLCADRLEGVARDAQGHSIDSLKLIESWPKPKQEN